MWSTRKIYALAVKEDVAMDWSFVLIVESKQLSHIWDTYLLEMYKDSTFWKIKIYESLI